MPVKLSPFMKLVPANNSPENLKLEMEIIDTMSYYKALFNHFQGTKRMELADIIGLNTPNHHPFDCLNKSSEAESKQIREIGRRAYCNAILPFSSKRMGMDRMETVVRGVEGNVAGPTMFETVHRVVYNDILHSGTNTDRCAQLVILMVEAAAIANYMLPPSQVRLKFWSISFLYSLLGGRRWDVAEGPWLEEAIEARTALNRDRAAAYNRTSSTLSRMSRWDVCLSRLRMLLERPSTDDEEKVVINDSITELLSIDIGYLNTTPDKEAQITTAIDNARDLVRACEAIASMAAFSEDTEAVPPEPVISPRATENSAAAGWIEEQVVRLFARPEAGVDLVQNYTGEDEEEGNGGILFVFSCRGHHPNTLNRSPYPETQQPLQEPAPQAGRAQFQGGGRRDPRRSVQHGRAAVRGGNCQGRGGKNPCRGRGEAPHRGKGTPPRGRGGASSSRGRRAPSRQGECRLT